MFPMPDTDRSDDTRGTVREWWNRIVKVNAKPWFYQSIEK